MIRWFSLAAVLAIFAFASGAYAGYGHENELLNPCFEQGGEYWEYSQTVQFNAGQGLKFDRPHIAYDPAGQGESGYLRQVVDDSLFPGWDPNLNRKVGTLSFWVYTTGGAYLKVGFDWWDRLTGPKPIGFSDPDYHYEILPTEYRSVGQWSYVELDYDWGGKPGNNQPRWVSIEFYFYGCVGGNEAAVDDVSFTAMCIPEPSGIVALASSILALSGFAWRRRRL